MAGKQASVASNAIIVDDDRDGDVSHGHIIEFDLGPGGVVARGLIFGRIFLGLAALPGSLIVENTKRRDPAAEIGRTGTHRPVVANGLPEAKVFGLDDRVANVFVVVVVDDGQEFVDDGVEHGGPLLAGCAVVGQFRDALLDLRPVVSGAQDGDFGDATKEVTFIFEVLLHGPHEHDLGRGAVGVGRRREVGGHPFTHRIVFQVLTDFDGDLVDESAVVGCAKAGTLVGHQLLLPLEVHEVMAQFLGIGVQIQRKLRHDGDPHVVRSDFQVVVLVVGFDDGIHKAVVRRDDPSVGANALGLDGIEIGLEDFASSSVCVSLRFKEQQPHLDVFTIIIRFMSGKVQNDDEHDCHCLHCTASMNGRRAHRLATANGDRRTQSLEEKKVTQLQLYLLEKATPRGRLGDCQSIWFWFDFDGAPACWPISARDGGRFDWRATPETDMMT